MKTTKSKAARLQAGLIGFVVWVWGVSLLIGGCAQQKVDPLQLPVLPEDEQLAAFPPIEEELIKRARLLLPLVVFKDGTVTEARLKEITAFLNDTFETHAHFAVIPADQVETLLSAPENRQYQPSNVGDAIQLGVSLKADFISQMQVTIVESKMEQGIDRFSANINLTLFTTDSGQVVMQQNVLYQSRKVAESAKALRLLVQQHFPLRGFILETRGGRQVAKLSLGRSLGIALDREFQVREREVKTEIIDGVARRTVLFAPGVLANIKVISVQEEDCWALVKPEDRAKIRKGQAVFSLPEKTSPFF